MNCVDLAVVAALIDSRQLADRAGLDLSLLKDTSSVQLSSYEVPKQVPTVAHGMKRGSRWILSASGGVQFQPWAFLEDVVEAQDVGLRTETGDGIPSSVWYLLGMNVLAAALVGC